MGKLSLFATIFFLLFTTSFSLADSSPDTDGDGLTDFEEMLWGTDPDNPDTDGDFLLDGEEIYVYSTNPLNPYSDEDSLRDGVEVILYGTDPSKWSTDGDQYSDGLELLGNSFACLNDPPEGMGSVLSPGDNVFVAAYPVIDIEIDSNISVEEIPIITFGTETWEEGTKGYSVANTHGSSYSVGTEETHTIGGWKDTSNEEADAELWGEYQEEISATETGYTSGWSLGVYSEVEVGTEVGGSVGFPSGGSVDVSAHVNVTAGVEAGVHADTYKGTTNSIGSGGEHSTQKIRSTSSSRGEKQESSFSTLITRTSYNETTVTNTNEIANGQKWSEATTIDTGNAGKLRFRFWINNTGSDIANELNDLRFNIKIGDNLPITYPPINEPGFSMQNLNPNSQIELGADIQITLEELEAIDMGQPIKISIADYSYGTDEIYFMSAWGEDVLVEIDDGVSDGDGSIDYYMTYVNFGETYLDVLKRLNTEVQIGNPANPRTEIELTIEDNFITSIVDNPVTEWSWWNIYSQEDVSTPIKFEDQLASKQTRLQLVYYKDSDHDYYTDRTELKIGTDPQEIDSHPSPVLIAGKIIEGSNPNKTVKLKLANAGNYDAYGIEAVLYSPDSTTSIPDPNQVIGGGGRIEVDRIFTPDETLAYNKNIVDCNEPVVLVRYNDPQGSHAFITRLDITGDPIQDISSNAGDMLPVEMNVQTNTEYTYSQNNWLIVDYFNSGPAIQNGQIVVAYQDPNGVIFTKETRTVDLVQGHNSSVFYWNPSGYLTDDCMGNQYKAVVIVSDYQEVELMWDVVKFKIIPYPVPQLINTFSDGLAEKEITFASAGSITEYIKLPSAANVINAQMTFEGKDNLVSCPILPSLEIGTVDGICEWELGQAKLQGQKAVLNKLSDDSVDKSIAFTDSNTKTVYLKIPKQSVVDSASINLSGEHSEQYYSYVYDEIDDNSIDENLWESFSNIGNNTVSYGTIGEYDGWLHCWAIGHPNSNQVGGSAYAQTLALPELRNIQSVRFRVHLKVYHSDAFTTYPDYISSSLNVFGNLIHELEYDQGGDHTEDDNSEWTLIKNNEAGTNLFDVYKDDVFMAQIEATDNIIKIGINVSINHHCRQSTGAFAKIGYVYYDHVFFPLNPTLEVGDTDGNPEWDCEGEYFTQELPINDFSNKLNSYLSNALYDPDGNCLVPLIFHSDTDGKLTIDNINITYLNANKTDDLSSSINHALNYNCDCSNCILNENCCSIPITFSSDSPGILRASDLRIIYEPADSQKADLNFSETVNINDFSYFAKDYNKQGEFLLGDINRDQSVDIDDLSILVENWLNDCDCD